MMLRDSAEALHRMKRAGRVLLFRGKLNTRLSKVDVPEAFLIVCAVLVVLDLTWPVDDGTELAKHSAFLRCVGHVDCRSSNHYT